MQETFMSDSEDELGMLVFDFNLKFSFKAQKTQT